MANQARGEVSITVGEFSYTLRPTFDALCELEDLVDKGVDQIVREVEEGRISGLRALIWVLLQDEHADEFQTLKQASAFIVAAGGGDAILPKLRELLELNSGDAGGQPANPPTAQADGTGRTSSPAQQASDWAPNDSGHSRRANSGTRSRRSRSARALQ